MKLKAIFSAVLAAAVMATTTAMTTSALDVTADNVTGSFYKYKWDIFRFAELSDGTLSAEFDLDYEDRDSITRVIVPDTVNGKKVTRLVGVLADEFTDLSFTNIEYIVIPSCIDTIVRAPIYSLNGGAITDVYYEGTEEEFNAIVCEVASAPFSWTLGADGVIEALFGSNTTIHYNSTGPDSAPIIPDEPEAKPFESTSNNVSANAEAGVIPDGAEFSAAMIKSDNGNYNYDLKFTKGGAEVQSNGKVTIKLPLPDQFAGKIVYVFHNENGKYINMNAEVDGNNVIFETDHFSNYILTTQDLSVGTSGNTSVTESDKDNSGNDNPGTGTEGIAIVIGAAAIAGATVIVSRKRR